MDKELEVIIRPFTSLILLYFLILENGRGALQGGEYSLMTAGTDR